MAGRRSVAVLTLMVLTSWTASSSESQAGPLFDWLFKRDQNSNTVAPYGAAGYPGAGYPGAGYVPQQATAAGYAPGTSCGTGFCQQTVVQYVPQIAYQTAYQPVPVTTYKTSTSINPANGLPMTCTRPCTTYTYQARRVPYTSYRPIYTTVPVNDPALGNTAPAGYAAGYSAGYTPGNANYLPPAANDYRYGSGYSSAYGANPYQYGQRYSAGFHGLPITPTTAYAVSPTSGCASCSAAAAPYPANPNAAPYAASPNPYAPNPYATSPYAAVPSAAPYGAVAPANPYSSAPNTYVPWQTPPSNNVPGATEWQPVAPGGTTAGPNAAGQEPADIQPSLNPGTPPPLRKVPLPGVDDGYGSRDPLFQTPNSAADKNGGHAATPWQSRVNPIGTDVANGGGFDHDSLPAAPPRSTPPRIDPPSNVPAATDASSGFESGSAGSGNTTSFGDAAEQYRARESDYNSRAIRDLQREGSPWEYDEQRVPPLLDPRDKTATSAARTRHAAVPIQWPVGVGTQPAEQASRMPLQRTVRQQVEPSSSSDRQQGGQRQNVRRTDYGNSAWKPVN